MILHRVGPHWWIPGQVVVWGLIEILQSQIKNASGFYAARIFLGLAESGFIPGALYILSRWYTAGELARRTVVFFYGASLAGAFGNLITAGCIKAGGVAGLHDWQW